MISLIPNESSKLDFSPLSLHQPTHINNMLPYSNSKKITTFNYVITLFSNFNILLCSHLGTCWIGTLQALESCPQIAEHTLLVVFDKLLPHSKFNSLKYLMF